MTDHAPQPTPPLRELPNGFLLKNGSHKSFDDGACLMEAVAYVAGEPHSDHPHCASRVLTSIAIRLNDRYDDEDRQLLAPLIQRLVGTRSTLEVDRARSFAMRDASIREIVPMALDRVGWVDLADKLRAIAPIVDTASARTASAVTRAVREEAYKRPASAAAAAAAVAASARGTRAADAAATVDAAADADAADAAADAAAAAAAAADAAADADATPEERARLRSQARRPIVLATIAAFERAIAITEAA